MSNPLFDNQLQPGNQGIFGLIKQLKSGNAQQMFNQMYQSNPQFRDFANSMKGKSPEQAFQEKGFDFSQFKNMIK
jgi:hypothetical protein